MPRLPEPWPSTPNAGSEHWRNWLRSCGRRWWPAPRARPPRPRREPLSLPEPEALLGSRSPVSIASSACLRAGRDELVFRAVSQAANTPVNVAVFLGVEDAEHELGERLASADRLRDGPCLRLRRRARSRLPSRADFSTLQVIRGTKPRRTAVAGATATRAGRSRNHHRAGGCARRSARARRGSPRARSGERRIFGQQYPSQPKLRLVNPPRRKSIDEMARDGVPASLAGAARQHPLDFRISGLCESRRGEQRLDRRPLQRVFARRDRATSC